MKFLGGGSDATRSVDGGQSVAANEGGDEHRHELRVRAFERGLELKRGAHNVEAEVAKRVVDNVRQMEMTRLWVRILGRDALLRWLHKDASDALSTLPIFSRSSTASTAPSAVTATTALSIIPTFTLSTYSNLNFNHVSLPFRKRIPILSLCMIITNNNNNNLFLLILRKFFYSWLSPYTRPLFDGGRVIDLILLIVSRIPQELEHIDHDGEEEYDDPVFVLTDEWREFFAKSEARRKLGS
ncbi:hypothetical protein V8G54_010414 [Vigna mungo]|uniref:Uncharacterized protein n=1 Tax=Vigna mungo TaxID=3915 RepID=A0AAQ3S4V3_VIGMU